MTDHNIGGASIPRPAGTAAASPCIHHYIIDANNHGVCCKCLDERDWPRVELPFDWREVNEALLAAIRRER